jgi:hypothetical protein
VANGIQEALKQAIATIVKAQPKTGQVYDRVKYSANWQRFKDQFAWVDAETGYTQIRGWWITLPTMTENSRDASFDMHWHNFTYPLHAVMSYSDSGDTEPDFNNMIWSVFEVLHQQGTFGLGSVNGDVVIDASVDVSVPTVDFRFYGSILCHHAEMRVTVGVGSPYVPIP